MGGGIEISKFPSHFLNRKINNFQKWGLARKKSIVQWADRDQTYATHNTNELNILIFSKIFVDQPMLRKMDLKFAKSCPTIDSECLNFIGGIVKSENVCFKIRKSQFFSARCRKIWVEKKSK